MQAVILSGGEGTRLRPLTATMPKPSVSMVNRPMISYMVDWLSGHGVTEVIMSVGFLADGLRRALDEAGHPGVNIRYVEEAKPLGTAGAVKFATEYLDERFLVLNGDVLAEFDLTAQMAQHEKTGARATLALVPVEDPTAYGLVLTDDERKIEAFLEKPDAADVPPNPRINAGAYVLERDVLEMIPFDEKKSFEHDIFPHLVGKGIYAYDASGYWLDLGTPERYMEATEVLLDRTIDSWIAPQLENGGQAVAAGVTNDGATLETPIVIAAGCSLGSGSRIGAYSVLGPEVAVGENVQLDRAVIQRGCTIGDGASVVDSIIAPRVQIGAGATIGAGTVVGEGARIEPGAIIAEGSRVDADSQAAV